jgi:PP-loop superfamily ATP-utilizing enzyme
MNVISYGGGVQSTAMLVLAAQGRISATHALFANTGDDSEHPATLEYVRNIATPWAAEHDIAVVELKRHMRTGEVETLAGRLTKVGGASIPIPVYFSGGAPGGRACTSDFKIRVIGKWLKANGANKRNKATVNIGISLDEMHRATTKYIEPYESPAYPLLDLRMTRQDCINLIERAGLPVPPKSACWFCPFHTLAKWGEMRRDEPALFSAAVELEQAINAKRTAAGKDSVWLTRTLKPLSEVPEKGPTFWQDDQPCDSGYCMT